MLHLSEVIHVSKKVTGYLHPGYAESLAEFGTPLALPRCGGQVLVRQIPNTNYSDLMGCYPLFCCTDWTQLADEFSRLGDENVSLVLVADPFSNVSLEELQRCFTMVRPFKRHFIIDSTLRDEDHINRHHRYYARKALKQLIIDRPTEPILHLEEWLVLYDELIRRHGIRGMQAFSRSSFERQLKLPGLVMFRCLKGAEAVGAQLWFVQNEVAYSHLAAFSELGYDLGAAYALYGEAIRAFKSGEHGVVRWIDLGAGAGMTFATEDGLTKFKGDWASGVRIKYLCGRILNQKRYEELSGTAELAGSQYFPAYRAQDVEQESGMITQERPSVTLEQSDALRAAAGVSQPKAVVVSQVAVNSPRRAASGKQLPSPLRVLVFPGGSEIGLELRQALAWRKEVELFSAGSDVSNHAPFVFANHAVLPDVHDASWIESLTACIARFGIDYIFPAYDDVLLALAENATEIKAGIITSPVETCRIARSKRATYDHLHDVVPVPRVFQNVSAVDEFPVFLKPDRGQGSQDTLRVCDKGDLANAMLHGNNRLILEDLPGEEYTVDCFSDRERGLLYCQPRTRERIRSGFSMASRPVHVPELVVMARAIANRMVFYGAWFFQAKRARDGILKLLEVAPRIEGTSVVSRLLGVNLPLLSLYEAQRIPVTITPVKCDLLLDHALVSRCQVTLSFQTVYVDLDDTLVVREKINPELVKFLYQAFNRGARVVLLTRYAGDLTATLRRYRLTGIFDEVVHLQKDEPKSSAIRESAAILIDDSYREREEVTRATGVPVFDTSMLETLQDERV